MATDKPARRHQKPQVVDRDRQLDDATLAYVRDCIESNTVLHSWAVGYGDGGAPALPIVRLNPPEVEYHGKVFQVEPDHALAFEAMVKCYPERVGLTPIIGPHPERKLAKLPAELKAIVDTNGKGSRLMMS